MRLIDSFRGEFLFLSNFYSCPVEYEGLTYFSSEAAFQAQKCPDKEGRMKYTTLKSPLWAKRFGRKERLPENWDTTSEKIMEDVLRAKFSAPALARRLKATGDAYLEEGNHWHDNLWGNCTCDRCRDTEGQNRLGRILMTIRSEL